MRVTLKTKKYPELSGLSPELIAVIVDEAVKEFLKTEQVKTLCAAFNKNSRKESKNDTEEAGE